MPETDPVLAQVLSPVRDRIIEIESEIADLERQLQAKKDELRPYRRVLSAASSNGQKPGPKPKTRAGSYPLSADLIQRVETYLRDHFTGREITATWVWKEWKASGEDHPAQQTILEVLKQLQSLGVLALARRGTGGSMIFRLV